MNKADEFQMFLASAIANDQAPKASIVDYPGYWLFVAGEYLKPKHYKRILFTDEIDERDVTAYKFTFTMDMHAMFRQQEDTQA